jgi:hypothetical protein
MVDTRVSVTHALPLAYTNCLHISMCWWPAAPIIVFTVDWTPVSYRYCSICFVLSNIQSVGVTIRNVISKWCIREEISIKFKRTFVHVRLTVCLATSYQLLSSWLLDCRMAWGLRRKNIEGKYIYILSWYLTELKENCKKSSGESVFFPRFEPGTSIIQGWIANRYIAMVNGFSCVTTVEIGSSYCVNCVMHISISCKEWALNNMLDLRLIRKDWQLLTIAE